jgi:hypothetical protein
MHVDLLYLFCVLGVDVITGAMLFVLEVFGANRPRMEQTATNKIRIMMVIIQPFNENPEFTVVYR